MSGGKVDPAEKVSLEELEESISTDGKSPFEISTSGEVRRKSIAELDQEEPDAVRELESARKEIRRLRGALSEALEALESATDIVKAALKVTP